ncbi:MAG: DUF4340 domain-containing protein, partial [Treponema sp.]|nr:DUF4340 domain-containing protein [Treponema sp.]
MIYKKKVLILSALVILLAVVYALTLFFDPDRVSARDASYVWLDGGLVPQADRIEISGSQGETVLSRINNNWVVSRGGLDYPVKQPRVADLLKLLSDRKSYPVRAGGESSHERLGVGEGASSRIVVRGGPGLPGTERPPLLDLIAGDTDAAGAVYLRRRGENEVRSGEDLFSSYINGSASSWYNLRLFPEEGRLEVPSVQQIRVIPPDDGRTADWEEDQFTLIRRNDGWVLQDSDQALDTPRVDSYVRAVLEAEGEDFDSSLNAASPVFTSGRIILELGDGSSRTLRAGPGGDQNRRGVVVSGSSFVYSLA